LNTRFKQNKIDKDQMSRDHVMYVYKRTQSWLLRRGRHRAFSFLFFLN